MYLSAMIIRKDNIWAICKYGIMLHIIQLENRSAHNILQNIMLNKPKYAK